MSKLRLDPSQESHSVAFGNEVIATTLAGGKSRFRRDQLGAIALVPVEWYLTASQYDYIMAFYRVRTAHGSLSFTLDLILDGSALAEYTAYFVPGTLKLAEVRGSVYIVSAQLEVLPRAENAAADLGLVIYPEAMLAAAGALTINVMSANLVVSGNTITQNAAGTWQVFYTSQSATDSFIASWRSQSGSEWVAGMLPFVPSSNGDPNGYSPGGQIIYRQASGSHTYLPPASGFTALPASVGDQYAVMIKDGFVYYFRSDGDEAKLLAVQLIPAGTYRFGGQMFSGTLTEIKLATF